MQNEKVKDFEWVYHGYKIPISTILLQIAIWLLVGNALGRYKMITEEEVEKTLDDLLHSVQMDAYFRGYRTGYKAGTENLENKGDPKRSILTEEEENGAAKMGEMKFNAEQICYRIQYLRKKEIVWAIRSILEGGEEGKTQLGGKSK